METAESNAASLGPRLAPPDPTLPEPWKELIDGSTNFHYYWNPETNVTQYERPAAAAAAPPLPSATPKLAPIPGNRTVQSNGGLPQQGQQMGQQAVSQMQQVPQTGQQQVQSMPQQQGSELGQPTQQYGSQQGSELGQPAQQYGSQLSQQGSEVRHSAQQYNSQMPQQASQMGQSVPQPGQLMQSQFTSQMLQYPGQQIPQQAGQQLQQQPGQQVPQQPGQQMPQHQGQQMLQQPGQQVPQQPGQQMPQHQGQQMLQQPGQQFAHQPLQQFQYHPSSHQQGPPMSHQQAQQFTQQQGQHYPQQGQQFQPQQMQKIGYPQRENTDFQQGKQIGISPSHPQQSGVSSLHSIPPGSQSAQVPQMAGLSFQSHQFGSSSVNAPANGPPLAQPPQTMSDTGHQHHMGGRLVQNQNPHQSAGNPNGLKTGGDEFFRGRTENDFHRNANKETPVMMPQQPKLHTGPMDRNQQMSGVPPQNAPPSHSGGLNMLARPPMPNMYNHVAGGQVFPGNNAPVGPPAKMIASSDVSNLSAVDAYRRQHEVTATGDNVPAPFMTFEATGFPPEILREMRYLLQKRSICRRLHCYTHPI